MFKPLGAFIRLRRMQRNLSQEKLAQLAGISRGQVALVEAGQNVSLLYLTKIARALEITTLPVGQLSLCAPNPLASEDLAVVVRAAEALERLAPLLVLWENAPADVRGAAAALDAVISRVLTTGASARDLIDAADALVQMPAEEQSAAGETLRSLTGTTPVPRVLGSKRVSRNAAGKR